MGRETVLVPVIWEEGKFPVFNGATPGRAYVNMTGPLPVSKWVSQCTVLSRQLVTADGNRMDSQRPTTRKTRW